MTRAGIAAADRKSKEKIADKDRNLKEKIERKKFDLDNARYKMERVTNAAKATKDLAQAAGGKGGIAGLFNHPEWYKKFGSDKFTAQLPTYNRIGLETSPKFLSDNLQTDNTVWAAQRIIPGIMVINYLSVLPNQANSSTGYKYSPINVGLSRFMSELRKLNSRIGDYDPSDFGIYWYAAVDYMYLIERTRTAIAAYNTYYIDNMYYADALIEALGYNAADFKAHIAEYKYLISKHIKTFNSSILIPKNLTFAQRRIWLAKAIVKDHKSEVSQLYVFRQRYLCHITDDENDLQFGSTDFKSMNYTAISNTLNTMLQQLTDSVGMQTMMADLRAGIPEAGFGKLDELNPGATVSFIEGDYDLEQIHNIRTLPVLFNLGNNEFAPLSIGNASLNIHAMADGYISQGVIDAGRTSLTSPGPYFSMGSDANAKAAWRAYIADVGSEFLNFYDDAADSDDILEATRLRHLVSFDSSDVMYSSIRGTELCTHFSIYEYTYQKSLHEYITGSFMVQISTADVEGEACALLSRFDWCPVVKFIDWRLSGEEFKFEGFYTFGELDKIVMLSNSNLELLHEQCCLSLFYIDSNEFNRA